VSAPPRGHCRPARRSLERFRSPRFPARRERPGKYTSLRAWKHGASRRAGTHGADGAACAACPAPDPIGWSAATGPVGRRLPAGFECFARRGALRRRVGRCAAARRAGRRHRTLRRAQCGALPRRAAARRGRGRQHDALEITSARRPRARHEPPPVAGARRAGSTSASCAPRRRRYEASSTRWWTSRSSRATVHLIGCSTGGAALHIEAIEATTASAQFVMTTPSSVPASPARPECPPRRAAGGAELTGLFLADGSRHSTTHVRVDHLAVRHAQPAGLTGIAAGPDARIFNGRRSCTKARSSRRRGRRTQPAVTPGAEIDTKPELEIYADDVPVQPRRHHRQLDAVHCSTCASRGLSETEAR